MTLDATTDRGPTVSTRPSAKHRCVPGSPRLIRTWRTLLLAAVNILRDVGLGIDARHERCKPSISI